MRKIVHVAMVGNFAVGGISATFICKVAPNWVLPMNVGNVVLLTGAFVWHTLLNERRKDQLTLPAIPRQPDRSHKPNSTPEG